MKILLLDIETAPNIAYVWELWSKNMSIPTGQLIDARYVLCWAAKWLGSTDIMFSSVEKDGEKTMLRKIHKLMDEADAIVHYNGKRFDIPALNKEFITNGFPPPAPYQQIDLLPVARSKFKFASNKLDYVAKVLGVGQKVRHKGFQLWIDCINHNPQAWKQMEQYNRGDVIILEGVYLKMLPWIKNHPNYGLHQDEGLVCTNCGSKHYHRRGFAYTKAYSYPRYQCKACGSWFQGRKTESKERLTFKAI